MPNRVIREGIIDSERINMLSWPAEVFYRRLQSLVDDYGCYDARIEMLRVKLYPLKVSSVSTSDIEKWMRECADAGLVRCYSVEKKSYLEILNFNQTIRIKTRKFPPPEDHALHMPSIRSADDKQMRPEREKEMNPDLNPKPKGEGEYARPLVLKKLTLYVQKNVKRFYPKEFLSAQEQALKFQKDHGITETTLKDPEIQKKWTEADARIIENNFGKKMREEIEDCYDYYSARNFTIDDQPINNWNSVMSGWMKNRERFKSKAS